MADAPEDISAPSQDVCVHHWHLGAPTGEVTHARCKLCGALRDFNEHGRSGSYNSRLRRTR
jgi:hypothetical protein